MSSRLKQAWALGSHGLLQAAAETLLFGSVLDNNELKAGNPSLTDPDFYALLEQAGLAEFGEHIDADVTLRYPNLPSYDDLKQGQIFIQIMVDPKFPFADFSVMGRFTDMYFTLKHNPATRLWQVDDAVIWERSQSLNDDLVPHEVPCEQGEGLDPLLQNFMQVFRETVADILAKKANIEVDMAKKLRPLIDMIRLYEESRPAFSQPQGAGFPASSPKAEF